MVSPTPRLNPYNPRDYLQLSTLLRLCAHCLGNTWDGEGEDTDTGGIKADLSKCTMARVICVYIQAGRFIFYYSRYCINPIDNSFQMFVCVPGVSERHLQAWWRDSEPGSHLSPRSPSLFSVGEQPFITLTVEEKVLCDYSTFSESVSPLSDVCLVLVSPRPECQKVIFSSSLVVEGGKEALSRWWLYFRRPRCSFLCPISSRLFQMYLWDMQSHNYTSLGMTFHLLICCVMVPHFIVIYYINCIL